MGRPGVRLQPDGRTGGSGGANGSGIALEAIWELVGSILLGIVIGTPAGYLTGRLRPGDPTLSEALGIVFLTAGLALWLDLSFLLAGIACGATVVNTGRHHARAFHEIEHIEWPFMIFFFILAGASLQVDMIARLGMLGAGYILLRFAGRLAGGWLGGKLTSGPHKEKQLSLRPLSCPRRALPWAWRWSRRKRFPNSGTKSSPWPSARPSFFELLGPALTQQALRLAGETGQKAPGSRQA
ncbi:cation:proton antiporter [Roseibium salinum]|nr:cation:proton antiporter [Roseibium salinum]